MFAGINLNGVFNSRSLPSKVPVTIVPFPGNENTRSIGTLTGNPSKAFLSLNIFFISDFKIVNPSLVTQDRFIILDFLYLPYKKDVFISLSTFFICSLWDKSILFITIIKFATSRDFIISKCSKVCL